MASDETRRAVTRLWDCLYRKDWDGVSACIADDGLYQDVPAPDRGAVGPANVVRRLRVGLDPVTRFDHELHRMVVDGDTAMLEHTETWHFETGEKIVNPFVTVHVVRDGRIALWRDYWDLGKLMAQAPQWWIERLARHSESEWS
jgi:ketosteroid isomerase-like protein